jgi:uncharacterized membrane protein HdeD (DUF308 family)
MNPVMIVSTLFVMGGITYLISGFGFRELDANMGWDAADIAFGILYTAAGLACFVWENKSRRREKRRYSKRYGVVDSEERVTMANAIWARAADNRVSTGSRTP